MMNRRLFAVMVFILIIFTAGCGTKSTPAAWKAEKDGKTIYLFGSIHAADKSFYPLPAGIENGYASSDALAVELDIRHVDQSAVTRYVLEKGMYPPGGSLKEAMGESFSKLKDYCEKNGLSWQQFNAMRPWLAGMMLMQNAMQKIKLDPAKGLDVHFMNLDPEKKIFELESLEAQLKYISGFPEDIQIMSLLDAVEDDTDPGENLEKLVALWKKGDADGLRDHIFKDRAEKPEYEPLFELMFDVRNQRMTEGILAIVAAEDIDTLFVVVGAGHLVGDKGMVALLADKGYALERI